MSEQMTETPKALTSTRRWPKVIAGPATWETGAAAHRTGHMPSFVGSPRTRLLAPSRGPVR